MNDKNNPIKTDSNDPITIQSLSHDGRGVALINHKITFIEGALPDEIINFIYTKKRSKFDEGKISKIIKASPHRITPMCDHFGVCGGCKLQHCENKAQIENKQNTLLEQFEHFGKTKPQEVLPPLTGPVSGYRRRARLGVKYVAKKGKVLVGFREKNSRYLADLHHCPVLHPSIGDNINQLSELLGTLTAYKDIPQIEVTIADNHHALIIRHLIPLTADDLSALKSFAKERDFAIFLQPGGPKTVHQLYPEQPIQLYYQLPDYNLKLTFHPSDFVQVNHEMNQQMINRALDLLALQPTDQVLDLFCGLGNFTLPISRYCQQVIGVEGDAGLVERAQHNATANHITNADFYCANLMDDVHLQPWAQKKTVDKIIIDPPRSGALEIIPLLPTFGASRIIYVSCNPATLARDAGLLTQNGYRLTKAGVMDMFPHTSHVESIALFTR